MDPRPLLASMEMRNLIAGCLEIWNLLVKDLKFLFCCSHRNDSKEVCNLFAWSYEVCNLIVTTIKKIYLFHGVNGDLNPSLLLASLET